MPDEFDKLCAEYLAARAETDKLTTAIVRVAEKIKRLDSEIESLARKSKKGRGAVVERLRALKNQLREARAEAGKLKEEQAKKERARVTAQDRFSAFTDPIAGVSRFADSTPIVLFPLRLETRYRTVQVGDDALRREFCVRVFPDDVLVDTFQPEIGETEYKDVCNYWTQRWRAGGHRAGQRAAWAALVRSCGAGRAKWLTEQVKPAGAEPASQPGEHILVIRPPAPLPQAEQGPIAAFWERMWATTEAERDAAFADLADALGEARARQVEAELVPVNFFDPSVKPSPSITPLVVFLDLPAPETLPISKDSWTRAARAWLLPERLVLMGFRDGNLVLQRIGAPIPHDLQIGPDPSAPEDQQIRADEADLQIPEPMRWTVDFEAAVAKGMGFVVDITESDPPPRFDRLFVLGVRLASDAQAGAAELSKLIRDHQASRKGFSLLPQGRPTNNTDTSRAAYSWWEDPDQSFRHFFETDPTDDPGNWDRRKDGAWLAGMLGIDKALLKASPNYFGTDQAEARAMNIALWPATLGYYMEQMIESVFSEETVRNTRTFFNRFVIGRGTVPLVRVGRQPYGILPSTVWSKMAWWTDKLYARAASASGLPIPGFLEKLSELTKRAVAMWSELAENVAYVGEPGDNPHQTLLSIVGLHPGSAEFYQRYARSFTHYYNLLQFFPGDTSSVSAEVQKYIQAGLKALDELGWKAPIDFELPEILEKIFLEKANLLSGNLVQAELSDVEPLAVTRADGLNYIAWLQAAARTSHDTLRRQEGFVDGVPQALLYHMLRHALDLGFIDAALTFRRSALELSEATFKAERKEPKYINVGERGGRSRWESLYRPEPAVTGNALQRLGDFISVSLAVRESYLATQLNALDVLKSASSGGLERAFAEHIDCLTYRLDAWRMGIQAAQLSFMRGESATGFTKTGIYIGAYGWLENVQPKKDEALKPVELDEELSTIFAPADAPPLMHDSTNFGHIHAPSLDHAVTAAILRNGHLANATPASPDLLAVDLTSERVRLALQIIEGIRNGQSLGALLGYRLERGLHEQPKLFLDKLIYDLRRAFPLAGNRNLLTRVQGLRKITKVEARNVVDGAALLDHIVETGKTTYPYGLDLPSLNDFTGPGLPSAEEIGAIIDGQIEQIRSVADAVADLQIAESVYQVVRGNYDRASGMLDALSKGSHPPVPEVVSTPRKGHTLTHRVGIQLKGGLLPGDPANRTPRAKGEPALAAWIADQLPDPARVFARVTWRDEVGHADVSLTPSMAALGLSPVDLFYMLDTGGDRAMPGFDDLLMDHAERVGAPKPRHDATFRLEYKPAGVAGLTLFEIAPLVRALRGLVLGTQSLHASDLALQNEASTKEGRAVIVRADKVQAVIADFQGTLAAIQNFINTLEAAVGKAVPLEGARDAARDNIDQWISDYAAAVRPATRFGLKAASLTTAVEGRRSPFTAVYKVIGEIIDRWKKKRDDFDATMAAYAALPGGATDEERFALLVRAGRIVSTTVIAPLPATIAALEAQVATLRAGFDTEFDDLVDMRDGATMTGATLAALMAFLPAFDGIDQTPLDLAPHRDSVLALARNLLEKAVFLREDINVRISNATAALNRSATQTGDKAQTSAVAAAKAVLGDAFILLPEFKLSADRLAEWDNAWNNRVALLAHLASPFPLEDWLTGVARVRERMRHLEAATLLGEALGSTKVPNLEAVQFPFRTDDAWLGLAFPEKFPNGDPFVLDEDKLLYTVHFGANAGIEPADPDRLYSGLLIDEWTEVVPADEVTTGLAFHFDRPNSEAPQAILLVTPAEFRGKWQWQDLVETLQETLDFARLRAVEPAQLDKSSLGPLLPAVISAVTMYPITAALNFSANNAIYMALAEGGSA